VPRDPVTFEQCADGSPPDREYGAVNPTDYRSVWTSLRLSALDVAAMSELFQKWLGPGIRGEVEVLTHSTAAAISPPEDRSTLCVTCFATHGAEPFLRS
jgi:hypothetical protein